MRLCLLSFVLFLLLTSFFFRAFGFFELFIEIINRLISAFELYW